MALLMVLEGEGRERPYTFPREAYRPNDPPPPPPPTYSQEIPLSRPPLVSQSPHAKKLEEAPQEEAHSFTRPPCHTLQGSEKVQTTTLWIICEKIAVRLCATACQQVLLSLFLGRSVGRTPSIYLILPQPTSPPMTIRPAQKKRRRGRGWCHYNCTTFSFSISSPWSPPSPPILSTL